MAGERKYTDQEVALILRTAVNMQRDGAARTEGLSLTELRDIAQEIGVDPDLVSEAAQRVPSADPGPAARFFGGSSRLDLHATYDMSLSPDGVQQVLAAIRSAMEHQGEVNEVMGAVEWKSVGQPSQLAVTVSPRAEGTDVHVVADRGAAALLTGFGSIGLGAALAAITGAIVEPGVAGGVSLMAGGVAGGVLLARAIWRRNTRLFREQVDRLLDAMRRAVTD